MPTAAVDDEGSVLYYEDSGAPPGSADYTTLVITHGYVIHAPIFRPMFPFAASQNLRLIAVNQREYPGSSPLSDAQLALLQSTDEEEQESVLVDLVKDLAHFICYIVKHENIPVPKMIEGKKSGGLCVMAWSAGNALLMGLLAYLSSFDDSLQKVLEEYIISVISYDPPSLILGITDPPKAYSPARDLKTPPDQLTRAFMVWASTYYEPYPNVESVTPSSTSDRKKLSDVPGTPRHLSSLDAMTPEQLAETTFPDVALRLGPGLVSWEIYAANVRKALFDTRGVLQGVPAHMLWGAMSPWNCAWSAKCLTDMANEPAVDGEQRREFHIERIEDIHHMGHWDSPELMMRVIADHVS